MEVYCPPVVPFKLLRMDRKYERFGTARIIKIRMITPTSAPIMPPLPLVLRGLSTDSNFFPSFLLQNKKSSGAAEVWTADPTL